MRTSRAQGGPFPERLYYENSEMETIAVDELRRMSLLPASPGPVRIERFIERRFHTVANYEDLDPGILGFTRFGPDGVAELVVARALAEEGTGVAERRLSSTLAHEAGHMLLHGHLFAIEPLTSSRSLFADDVDVPQRKILCRDNESSSQGRVRGYDGRWWEYQANRMIGALLIPRPLVAEALRGLVTGGGAFGATTLDPQRRSEAVQALAAVFVVNQPVARLRLDELYPAERQTQLTL